jgi:hypothetical protein
MTVDSGAPPRRAAALAALAALAVAALATGLAGIAGAAPPTQRHYPPAVRRQFTAACARTATQVAGERLTNRQARRLCTVTLSCIERRLTFRQFVRLERNLGAGRRDRNAAVITRCERAALADFTA